MSVPSIITTTEQLRELVDHYSKSDAFVFDVETIGEDRKTPLLADVRWISLACGDRYDTIPMGHPNGWLLYERPKLSTKGRQRMERGVAREDLNPKYDFVKELERGFSPPPEQLLRYDVFEALRPLFFGNALKIAHNIKYDLHAIAKYYSGEYAEGPYFDTMLVSWLLDVSRRGSLSLKDCVKRECGIDMVKGVGEDISQHSFEAVAEYSLIDAEVTWKLWQALDGASYRGNRESQASFRWLRDLEMALIPAVLEMESSGVRIDLDMVRELDTSLRAEMDTLRDLVYVDARRVFNVQSVREKQEVLFLSKASGGKGLKPIKLTPSAAGRDEGTHTIYDYSVDAETLEHYRTDHGVRMLLSYLAKNKIHNTYVLPYLGGNKVRGDGTEGSYIPSKLRDGRVYGRFQQHGTDSGRFSCVAGETLLETSRGVFRFDEYIPEQGDLVLTHEGRWMPVVRKIYKGVDQMYEVRSSLGGNITCTADHRLLTPSGWVRVGDLTVGDEVIHVGEEVVRERSQQCGFSANGVQSRRQADYQGVGWPNRDSLAQHRVHFEDSSFSGGISSGEGSSVLTVEVGVQKPYAGQEWFPTPQLHRGDRGRGWLSPEKGAGSLREVASDRDGGTPRIRSSCSTQRDARPSPGREQEEQRPRQPGAGDPGRPSVPAQVTARVDSITFVGAMGVWDIEVGGDHSYAAHGFLNHNSSDPNLQNIPSRTEEGKLIRRIFVPSEGMTMIVADYSQIEPRIIAALSQDPVLVRTYREGGDVYEVVGERTGVNRASGKELVLSISYGVGADKIAARIGCSPTEARDLLDYFSSKFSAIPTYKRRVVSKAAKNGYSETVLGRRRRLPDLRSTNFSLRSAAERQAFNHRIQGTAADIMKVALINIWDTLPPGARMLMTVHDEVIVEAPTDIVPETVEVIREAMEGAAPAVLDVPFPVDIKTGASWMEGKG